jgi:hypothetical protein
MIKRILNYFFGKKETNETPVNSIHDEINETLKKRKEILNSLNQEKVILSETVSTEKPKKPRAPRKPKAEVSIDTDKATKVKPVRKAKTTTASTEEKPKRTRKPKTDQ